MRLLTIFTVTVLLAGCATSGRVMLTPVERDTIIASAASAIRDPDQLLALEVGSSGPTADASFIALSQSGGPSKLAKQVAKLLSKAEGRTASVLLFGPNSKKVRQVASDALSLTRGNNLTKLTFLFHGDACDFEQLKKEGDFPGTLIHVPGKNGPNTTSEGIRQPADGSPKPSM